LDKSDDRPQIESDPMRGYCVFASALDMEDIVRASILDIRVVRGGLFYGPQTMREQRWIEEVMDPRFQVPADGQSWVSLVHVEDYASALLHVLERGEPRHPYIACDDVPIRLADLYAMAAARVGIGKLANGGAILTRSFRTSNGKLRGIGWAPALPQMQL
jgi:nucleoside-diphosphate-sugar epimerase